LDQNYSDVEIIIVDDSDRPIFDEIGERYSDLSNVRVVRGDPPDDTYIPDAHARKKGVELSEGTYVSFLDSDDTWEETRLTTHVEIWERHPNIGFTWDKWAARKESENSSHVRGDIDVGSRTDPSPVLDRGENYRILDGDFLANVLWLNSNFIHMSAGFTSREALMSIGNVPIRGLCDWHMWILLASNFDVGIVDEVLTTKNLDGDRLDHETYHTRRSEVDTHISRWKLLPDRNLGKYHEWSEICPAALYQNWLFAANLFGMLRHHIGNL
ncbi:MAG: glycosyltransferase family 2 protein, partial [Halorhabdus sp.]